MEQNKEEIQEETKEEKELKRKKHNNIKIYKIYRIFSWDLLFYYAIFYLFVTIEKGYSAAQVLQIDGFYILFKFMTQIPCTLFIQKFGKRKSLIIANFIAAVHILVIMVANSFTMILIAELLCAVAYNIKATCETDMLYDSLEHNEERGHKFAKIEGKANSRYYLLEGISSALTGFLFVINAYIPMSICFLILMFSFILSLKFEEIHKEKGKMHIREEISNLRTSFKSIFRSNRLKYLLLFNGIFVGIIKIIQNIRNTVLLEIGLEEQYFGVVFAVLEIITAIATRRQGSMHKRFKNKTLTILSIPTVISFLIIGAVISLNFSFEFKLIMITILFGIQYISKGPYYVLIKRYINNFTDKEKRVKIATANNIIENLIASLMIFGASFILDNVTIEYTTIIIGCITTIGVVLLLDYMRKFVGLKPEEYNKKEIL